SERQAKRTEEILRQFHEESALGHSYDARLLQRLWAFVAPHRRLLFFGIGLGLVVSAMTLVRPLIMKWVIDDGVMAKNPDVLFQGALAFAVVVLSEQFVQVGRIYATQLLGARTVGDMRSHIFAFLHTLPLKFFDRQPVGRLVTRVT